jgi:WS/DGAT/MGAT family acyltransferase
MEFAREFQESVFNPQPRIQQGLDLMRALNSASPWLLRPAPRTPFAGLLSPERKVAFSQASFVEIRQIRTSLGGTVNDVVLAILSGALRRYMLRHGYPLDGGEPRVAIPVNVRLEDEKGAMGNRISAMITTLPIGEADPAERLRTISARVDDLKKTNLAGALELLLRAISLTPVPVQAFAGRTGVNRLVNLICTNVPGPMIPLYCVGHLMLAHYPLVPLSLNMGLGVGVTSYNQRLFFGLMADPRAMADVEVLKECLDESFLELRAAAGVDVADVPELVGTHSTNGEPKTPHPAASELPR